MRLRIFTLITGVLLGVLTIYWQGSVAVVYATDDNQLICQTYRLRADAEAAVYRTCASDTCEVAQPLASDAEICVRGVANDNPDYLVVDLIPGDLASDEVYVLASQVEPGRASQRPEPIEYDYCDAYTPRVPSIIVRSGPSLDSTPIGELVTGDSVCIENYDGSFIYWLGLQSGGWVNARDMDYFYVEDAPCEETWAAVSNGVQVHSCSSFTCDVTRTLAVGEWVCISDEGSEDLDWVGFEYEGRTGWVYGPLLEDAIDPENTFFGPPPKVVAEGVTIADVNLRSEDTLDAPIIAGIAAQTPVELIAISTRGWYYVQVGERVLGWMSPTSINVATENLVLPLRRSDEVFVSDASNTLINAEGEVQQPAQQEPVQQQPDVFASPTASSATDPLSPEFCRFYASQNVAVNVRSTPSTAGTVVGTVPAGEQVCVALDAPQSASWFFVRYVQSDDTLTEGYIASTLLSPLPGQELVATPTPAPTTDVIPDPTSANAGAAQANATSTAGIPVIESNAVSPTPQPGVCGPGQGLGCITATPPPGLAFIVQPTEVRDLVLSQTITFDRLGQRDALLESPQSNTSYSFLLPSDWAMEGNNILFLDLIYDQNLQPKEDVADVNVNPAGLTSQLDVFLDGTLVSSVSLGLDNVQDRQTLEIPLPAEILNRQQFHRIELNFGAQDHCRARVEASVFTSARNSGIRFEYREQLPVLDLALYPRPFYNIRPVTESEHVVMVLPDNASPNDLQAAAAIAGGIGYLTENSLQIRYRELNELSDFERENSNLILVGKPITHTLINDYYERDLLPTQLEDGAISISGSNLEPTDGVVQLVRNFDNPLRAVMLVTSLTDAGLVKAAQAMAGPRSVLGQSGPVLIVSDVKALGRGDISSLSKNQLTLRDLGQNEDVILQGLGQSRFDISFTIPPGTELSTEANVEVFFNYSRLLENANSSLTVLVNETPIESIVLGDLDDNENVTDPNAEGIRSFTAAIAPGLVTPGAENFLTFIVNAAIPSLECQTPDGDVVWLTLSDRSSLNLPRTAAEDRADTNFVGLFPAPFGQLPNLSDLWINLPTDASSEEVEGALRLVSQIASSAVNAEGISPRLNRGTLPDGIDVSKFNYILIGRPTTNPLISALNDVLPQPFLPNTDIIIQQLDDVDVRLPDGFEVGILQKFPSPWKDEFGPDRKIMVITGTGPNGQRDATNILVNQLYAGGELAGDVVFVSGTNVTYVDSSRVYDDVEIILAAPELVTEQFESQQTATVAAELEALGLPPNVTVTPVPVTPLTNTELLPDMTATLLVVGTPSTPTPTLAPIFIPDDTGQVVRVTDVPLIAAAATPAAADGNGETLADNAEDVPESPRPFIIDVVLIVTGVVLLLMAVGLVIRLFRIRRPV